MMAGVHFPKENGRQQAQADGTDEWVNLKNRNPPAVRARKTDTVNVSPAPSYLL